MTSCDPTKILEAAKGVLNQMPLPVSGFVVSDLPFAVGSSGNNGACTLIAKGSIAAHYSPLSQYSLLIARSINILIGRIMSCRQISVR